MRERFGIENTFRLARKESEYLVECGAKIKLVTIFLDVAQVRRAEGVIQVKQRIIRYRLDLYTSTAAYPGRPERKASTSAPLR